MTESISTTDSGSDKMDPRCPEKVVRYSDKGSAIDHRQRVPSGGTTTATRSSAEIESENELTPDYVAVLSLIASTLCILGSIKWLSWMSLYTACVAYAKGARDNKTETRGEIISAFVTAFIAIFASYYTNPDPIGVKTDL